MMPTPAVGHNQINGNGARPASPWPYTAPAVLDLIEGLRDDLLSVAEQIDALVETTENAVEFVGARVEMARVRERRRNRRGMRKAQR
jgi:hypothetical protein